MPHSNAAPGRLPSEHSPDPITINSAYDWALMAVERSIAYWDKFPDWDLKKTDALQTVIDLGKFILWVVCPLVPEEKRPQFKALAEKCQDCARSWVPQDRIATEYPDRRTLALILDKQDEQMREQRDLRDLAKQILEKLPARRVRKPSLTVVGKAVAS